MTDIELPPEIEAELKDEPWLAAYVAVGDTSLEPARRCFELDQAAAFAALNRAHVHIQVRHSRGEVLTTSYDRAPT